MLPATLQFLIAMIAYATNERMQRKLDYTQVEVRALKDILVALTGGQRISFTADQRGRLSLAESNGVLERLGTLPTHVCGTSRAFTQGASQVSLTIFWS
jgi:hypothetical protein